MPLGDDKQYDETWEELDKVRRRQEIRRRLKAELIELRWNPFRQMKKETFIDPAHARYMDLRKKGRMPGAPFSLKVFFSLLSVTLIPIGISWFFIKTERKYWLREVEKGEIATSQRWGKTVL